MKKYIILTTILLSSFYIGNAQRKYLTSKNLEPFVGRWEYKTATETFIIELQKSHFISPNLEVEQVHGTYMYIKNGSVIGNYMSLMKDTYDSTIPIAADNTRSTPSNRVRGWFDDKKLDKEGDLIISLVPGKNEIRWQLFEPEGAYFIHNGVSNMPTQGFSVPTDVIMVKVTGNNDRPPLTLNPPPNNGDPAVNPGADIIFSQPAKKDKQ